MVSRLFRGAFAAVSCISCSDFSLSPVEIASIALLGVLVACQVGYAEDRTFDGTGNNVANPLWGSAGTDYSREASGAHYADNISMPQVAGLPSARAVSNSLMTQGEDSVLDARGLTAMVYTWGQFVDHDMDLRTSSSPPVAFNIPVPFGDPSFDPAATGTQVIPVSRSGIDPTTGTSAANPAQQVNSITSFLDASMVYGSNPTRAAWLRAPSGGLLKSTAAPTGALLPRNDGTQVVDGLTGPSTSTSLFVAGDTRVNEQVGITSVQTLLMREHNRQATLLSRANPGWSDEQVYQMARKITSAEMSAITYNEFLPAMLGSGAMPAYSGYNPSTDPSISNAFAAVAFRVGHSMLDDDIERVGADGKTVPQGNLPLRQAFFNPGVVNSFGIDPMLRGFTTRIQQSVDPLIVDDIRNFLFGPPGAGGMDLAAIDIQRARDHGLADYNTMRQDFGLAKVTTFAQITADANLQAKLQSLYGSVDKIDAFVGTLVEDHLPGSSVGPLTSAMLVDQFNRLRAGDRLFYLNDWCSPPAQITSINNFSLSELIRRNTFVRNIQDNAFIYSATPNYGSAWNLAGGGSWSTASNWTTPAQVPNGAGVTANFLTSPTSSSSVSLDAPITVGAIVLSISNNVTLNPGSGGSLTFDNLGSNAGVLMSGGTHTIAANVNMTDSLTALYYAAGGLTISGNISESNIGRSITIDGSGIGLQGGGVTTLSGTNTFTGGAAVIQSQLKLNAAQAQGALGGVASASNNGEIVLGFTPTASHRYAISDLGAIQGSSAQLAALDTATNVSLTSGAMIVRQTAGGSLPSGLGTAGNLYNGYNAGVSVTGANASITIGATSGTAFKGIGAGRSGGYTWGTAADTLTLSGNADFVSLGNSTLSVAAKVVGGLAADTVTKRGSGTVKLTNAANTFAANNIVVESGTLQYAYGTTLNFPAATSFNIKPDATLQFNDGFSTTINGTVVNNGNIVKPAGLASQLVFKGGPVTGSGLLLSQDTQAPNSGSPNFIQATTAQILAHAILFDNGQANTIGGLGGFDPINSSPILAVNGPNTSVHITGKWDGDGANQFNWLVVNNGAKVYIDSTAQLDTISDDGKLRTFNTRGDGTGVVEFADGFVANSRDSIPDVVEFYVWSPGNFRWITHSSTNFPDSNIEINQEDGGVWSVQTRAQTTECGVTTSRSFTIETQADLTLGKDAAFGSFVGTTTVTKTGSGTLTVAGEWSNGGATSRGQSASGTTWLITAGKFVTKTDMGQASTSAGPNGVFELPGAPASDDVDSTNYIFNVVVNNAGTTADFNASQHLKSLKINSGGTANLNTFTYGGGSVTTLTTDSLGVDTGTGTLNIVAGNVATFRTSASPFNLTAGATLTVQGSGTFNINCTQTHGAGAVLNVAAGTTNISTSTGPNLSINSSGTVNLSVAQQLAAISTGVGGAINVSGGDLTVAGSTTNNGAINIASGRTANFNGNATGDGNYTGTGTAIFSASYSPGNGPASITFGGKATLTPTATLNIELGGTTAGSQFDAVHVTNQLTLAGTLAISLINFGTYAPLPGDSFHILFWGSRAGTFASLNLAPLPGGLTWDSTQLYTTGTLSIGGLLGDYNLNGIVDAPDYVLWRKSLPQSGIGLAADGNGDHTITPTDFDIWRAHYGQVPGGGGSGSVVGATIPEPSSMLILILGMLLGTNSHRYLRSRD